MENSLITSNDIKNYTSISNNVDPELLSPFILIAQQLYVEPVLGSALYDDILTKFDNGTLIGGEYDTLYNQYIIPALAFCSWYSSSPFLHIKTNRSGVQLQSTDSSTPVSVEEFSMYSSRLDTLKNFYLDKLKDYLEANSDTYTLYRSSTSSKVSFGGGLFLNFK